MLDREAHPGRQKRFSALAGTPDSIPVDGLNVSQAEPYRSR
jgi:hypothetical protein